MYKFSGKPTFDVYVTNLPDDIDEVKNQIMETFLTEDFFLKTLHKKIVWFPLCVCVWSWYGLYVNTLCGDRVSVYS